MRIPAHGAEDFNPLSPHGERPRPLPCMPYSQGISIHSPHTGRDGDKVTHNGKTWISIHSPHTGRDTASKVPSRRRCQFQSTLPTRGETRHTLPNFYRLHHFNPLSPHGERPLRLLPYLPLVRTFQSTLPTRGETRQRPAGDPPGNFNPLSPHGERPDTGSFQMHTSEYFNPLSPHGERPRRPINTGPREISIHSPHTGRDGMRTTRSPSGLSHFNPLSPHGERPRGTRASPCTP